MFQAEGLFEPVLVSDQIAEVTSAGNWVRKMLEAERALAQAEAEFGVIPAAAATEISEVAHNLEIDPSVLGRSARDSGTPVISLIRLLTENLSPSSKPWVHFAATSQDILDTATMLVAREAIELIVKDLTTTCNSLAALSIRYRDTPMVSRTLLQHALPTTFGLKVAIWLGSATEAGTTLVNFYHQRLAIQFGGAGGTLAALGELGVDVGQRSAEILGLAFPVMPWQAQRNRIGELGNSLALVVGSLAKIATDVALGSQAEIGEMTESLNGGGGSSAMPQKVNPVGSVVISAAFRRVQGLVSVLYGCMIVENERGAGEWQAEWQTLRDLLQLAGGATQRASQMVANLQVSEARMEDNLARGRGSIMSERLSLRLSEVLGRTVAHDLVRTAVQRCTLNGTSLEHELSKEKLVSQAFTSDQIAILFDPAGYLGSTQRFIDGALTQWETAKSQWRHVAGRETKDKS